VIDPHKSFLPEFLFPPKSFSAVFYFNPIPLPGRCKGKGLFCFTYYIDKIIQNFRDKNKIHKKY